MNDFYATALAEGFARPGARHTSDTFDVVGGPMRIIVDDDVERAADLLRPTLALYIGGMGARRRQLPPRGLRPDGIRGAGRRHPGPLPGGLTRRPPSRPSRPAWSRTSP